MYTLTPRKIAFVDPQRTLTCIHGNSCLTFVKGTPMSIWANNSIWKSQENWWFWLLFRFLKFFWSNLFETFFSKLRLHKIEKCSPPRAAVNLLSNFWSDRSKQPFSDILQEFSFWYLAALDLPCFNLNRISSEKLQYFYSSHICVFLIFYQTKCQLYKAQVACLPEIIII